MQLVHLLLVFITFFSLANTQYQLPSIIKCGFNPAPPAKSGYGDTITFNCQYDIVIYYHTQATLASLSIVIGANLETPTNTDFSVLSYSSTSGTCSFLNATNNIVHCVKMTQLDDPNWFNVTMQINDAIRSSAWTWQAVFTDSYDEQASGTYVVDINQPNLIATFNPSAPVTVTVGETVPVSINLTNTGGSFSSPLECTITLPSGLIPSGNLPAGCTVNIAAGTATCVSSANTPFGAGDSITYAVNLTASVAQTVVVNASCKDVKGLFGPYYPNIASSSPSRTPSAAASSGLPAASSGAVGVSPSSSPVSSTTTGTGDGGGDGTTTTTTGTGGDGNGTTGGAGKVFSWLNVLLA